MNSRERVLTALAVKQPDQVPFFDWVDDGIQKVLMGTEQLNEAEFARKIGFDAIQIKDYLAPVFTEQSLDDHVHNFVGDGLIKSEKDLDLMVFPDPYDEKFYDKAKQFMDQYGKEELAIYASLRAAMQHTIFSMGITTFSYGLYDNLKFVETVFDRFIDWNCVVAEKLQSLGAPSL